MSVSVIRRYTDARFRPSGHTPLTVTESDSCPNRAIFEHPDRLPQYAHSVFTAVGVYHFEGDTL